MKRIGAVARQMIAEAIRMKIALFFICLLAVIIFGLPFAARGDNTVSGAVQSFLAYSLASVSFVLSLLTLFMSRSLSDELVNRQILILMTKPLPRWQFLVGKWLGIVVFDLVLLTIAGAGIYGMCRFIAYWVPARDELDRRKLNEEIFTARHQVAFEVPDFTAQVNRVFEQRKDEGLLAGLGESDPERVKQEFYKSAETSWRNVPAYEARVFEFQGVLCDRSPDKLIQIRYKCYSPNAPGDEIVRTVWYVGHPDKAARTYEVYRRDVNGRFHTFSVPADAVAPDGTLSVRFENNDPYSDEDEPARVVSFQGTEAVAVLFAVGTFEGNLIRMLGLEFFQLVFLAALGLLTTSVFSFPVASLVSLTVYVMAAFRGFVAEALEWIGDAGVVGVFQVSFSWVLKVLFFLIPNFSTYDAVGSLVDGRNVTLKWVLMGLVWLVGIQTTAVLMLACLLFHRREVSEVSV